MPITFGTFLIGWLAIAGLPPLAGFWAKGDVLTNVYAKSPALWAVGAVTALLTAYYMSRLFYLTFTGKARWSEPGADGSPALATPHESPWQMTLPLVILAVCAAFGEVLDLPFVHTFGLDAFLSPVFSGALYAPMQSASTQIVLSVVDAVLAVIGIAVAWVLWSKTSDRPELTPPFLRHVWYWDEFYDRLIGRPSTALSTFSATVIDDLVIDGAVMATATAVTTVGAELRKTQTGYVRQYAVGIVAGLCAIIFYLVVRGL